MLRTLPKRIKANDGDVLIIRAPKNVTTTETREMARQISELFKPKRLTLLVVPDGYDIEALDEATMNKLGWFRNDEVNTSDGHSCR